MLLAGLTAAAHAPDKDLDSLRARYVRPATIPFPADNVYTAAKAELGRQLFFDPIFSASGRLSCASCHQPDLAWGDGLPRAMGDKRLPMSFRSPTLLNIAWLPRLGWSGRFRSIESVGFVAIAGSANMNLPAEIALERLRDEPGYVEGFARAFGEPGIDQEKTEAALATYERTIVSGQSPFDRWVSGDDHAIGDDAKKGFALFNAKAGCSGCHQGWAFTDGSFHDIGTATGSDVGRGALFPTSTKLRYAFKTPTLRDVAKRAPYMHDGSVASLEAVIDLYDQGGIDRPSRSELIHPLGLTDGEKKDLVVFLRTLTSDSPMELPAAR